MGVTVAIDGPAGSGKSTVARALARRLGLVHVDTGAYYRAATLVALRAGVDPGDGVAIQRLLGAAGIERRDDRTLVDGADVEADIRGPAVTAAVSSVAAHRGVREALVRLQRRAAAAGAVVEGRDAGTVVVPEATLKVWLTASPQQRATRRARQLGVQDEDSVREHLQAIARRDAQDAAQMSRAEDVVEVDTTARGVDDVVEALVGLLVQRTATARDQCHLDDQQEGGR